MEKNDKIFIDEKGYEHKVNFLDEIGEGAQGKVFRTNNRGILVKVAEVGKPGEMKWKVNKIRSLNLPKNLNFALPIVNLNIPNGKYEGYIMRIMEDMNPISYLMRSSFKSEEGLYKYYDEETGGLKRRLEILKKIAYDLFAIHSRGIVYGDISPNNLFVSSDVNHKEVWFIDCDNMEHNYDVNYTIGSPGFCSPEIRKALPPYNEGQQRNTIENDIYSFANLAFHIIFLADPFRGSILEDDNDDEDNWDDEDDDWGKEEEGERKFDLGEVSWVGEEDPSNRPLYGLSSWISDMISPELKELINKTLGYEGRRNPKVRPSMRIWYEEINSLLNSLVTCECGYSYYDLNISCLRCGDEKGSNLRLEVEYSDGKLSKTIVKPKEIEEENSLIEIKYSDLGIGRYQEKEEVCLELSNRYKKYSIRNKFKTEINIIENNGLDGEEVLVLKPNKKEQVIRFEGLILNIDKYNLKIKIVSR